MSINRFTRERLFADEKLFNSLLPFAKYDEEENTIEKLKPYKAEKHFYEDELIDIEYKLEEALEREMNKSKHK